MSLGRCIPDLIAQGKIPARMAGQASQLYDELVLQYEGKFGRSAAESMATDKALKALEGQLLDKKRQALLTVKAQAGILDNAKRLYANGKFADGPVSGDAMLAHLVRDERAPFANVEYRWHNVKQTALATMYDILAKHRANLMGQVRNKSDLLDVVRELFGQSTGSVNARELADAWKRTGEYLRQRFNAAGGSIGKLEGWGLPQSHDALRVGSVSREGWIDEIVPMLDRARMIDESTGLPFSDGKLRTVLGDVYESIVSDGWSKRTPGAAGQSAVASRSAEHRFLHFASADQWLAYNEKYGSAGPLDSMLAHVEFMSRDIAMMEILGPNPAATVRWMKDMVAKDAFTRGTLKDRMGVTGSELGIDKVFNTITGQSNRIANRKLALFGSTIRNWQTSTKLGSALLSSFSDAGTQALTRHYNGLSAMKTVGGYMQQLNPADAADREFARRAGIIGDEFTGMVGAGGRVHMDEMFGGRLADGGGAMLAGLEKSAELSRRLADANLRLSGLNAFTVAGRQAMYSEFSATITGNAGKNFDALDAPFRDFLRRYGIGRDGWDRIRAADRVDHKGMDWIDPSAIKDQALRDRLMEGILTEIDFAVPTGGLRQRALVSQLPRGTVLGEIVRTGFQFKMFPITVMAMHGGRLLAQSDLTRKAAYGVAFLGVTTLTGALGYQLAQISKGKDPEPMGSADFIKKAMLKGGGLGIYGDLLNSASNEYGQKFGDITAGPGWSTGQSIVDLVTEGKVAQFAKREVPFTSIWYLRAAYERLLVDTVGEWTDEDYADSYKRMERRVEKEGSAYWAPPGSGMSGLRAPNFGNALNAPPPEDE